MRAPEEEAVVHQRAAAQELADVDVGLDKLLGVDWSLATDDTLIASAALVAVAAAKLDAVRAGIAGALDQSDIWAAHNHANAAAMLNTLTPNRHGATAKRDVLTAKHLREIGVRSRPDRHRTRATARRVSAPTLRGPVHRVRVRARRTRDRASMGRVRTAHRGLETDG
ncbi:MAG: hypothetical protein P8N02_07155 [Actinomycetota bacterium]|nr:hypothetical protein [Actinomycetota bacterium]